MDLAPTIVMISDTHGARPSLPAGDVLVHCGDLTHLGSFAELKAEVEWLKSLPFRHVILVGGNHDMALGNLCDKKLENQTRKLLFGHIHYLRDSGVVLEGVKFWGSPWIPAYAGVFNLPEDELQQKWDLIPSDTDVLVTHGPPAGTLDGATGSPSLAAALRRIQPSIHCFGHVHEHHGQIEKGTHFFNCAGVPFTSSLSLRCSL
jgi:Icc-related predicted phosphoesterase